MAPRDGAHRFVERKIDESAGKRGRPDRGRFRKAIGVVDERLPPYLERFGNEASPALVAEADGYKVYQVRWDVLAGVHGEGAVAAARLPRCRQAHYLFGSPKDSNEDHLSSGLRTSLPPVAGFSTEQVPRAAPPREP